MCKKDIILFISIFCVLALISGSTFAYWGWQSDTNKSVVFNTSHGIEDYVTYDAGEARFVGNFQPSSSHCGGKSNTLSFSKSSEVASETLMATIKMDINSIQSNISASQYVKWTITSGTSASCGTALASGTFYGKSNGNVVTLLADQEITTSTKTFTVWLWIDSAGTNLSSLSGETLDVNIWTQIDMTSTD